MEGKKSHECIIKIIEHHATSPLAFFCTNICGMIHPTFIGGAHFFISFTNDFSYFTWSYFLKQKSEILKAFNNFCAKVEFQFIPFKLLVLCNDHRGKYVSRDFPTFCIETCITPKLIQAFTSSHNGVLEHKNYTILEKVCSMVVDA